MRVLFLDMDGVMNSHVWFTKSRSEREQAEAKATGYESWTQRFTLMIDPDAVPLLDEIIKRADAHIVISSSWRIHFEAWQIAKMLKDRGSKTAVERFIGRTPNGAPTAKPEKDYGRGNEIQAWLDGHPEVESFAILDDDSDMAHLTARLVKTSWMYGMDRAHVESVVSLLTEAL